MIVQIQHPVRHLWSSDSVTNENNSTYVDSGNRTVTKVPIRSDMVIWYSTVKGCFPESFVDNCN